MQALLPPGLQQAAPKKLEAPRKWPASDDLNSWGLLPTDPNWASHFADEWKPGEATAIERLSRFAVSTEHYATRRDLPSEEGTSRLSPHLHFGEISPRKIWHALPASVGEKFRKELAWRDFSRNIMLTQPTIGEKAGRREFEAFPWRTGREAERDFRAWTRGRTGYPIVDAGMRQLWATGWMHNRVRMITASFLVKHLLIDWRRGAEWFWDTLIDADYGNNGQNWQWIAGTGIDSQPFHRIMAPIVQAEKFAAADYIRQWVPELEGLTGGLIHKPSQVPSATYPNPIVDHGQARLRAISTLRAFSARLASKEMTLLP
jgi:deoxyribodipyrimidine photo-lyase